MELSDTPPTIERTPTGIRVKLATGDPHSRVFLSAVVDLTDFGEITGVEVLDFRRQIVGGGVPEGPTQGVPRWSYDAEVDALYIHTSHDRSQGQQSRSVQGGLDDQRRLVEVVVPAE